EVRLGAVIGDEDLAVVVRRHGAGVDVDVGVELQDRDGDAARLEDPSDRGGGDALAERAGHAAGHKDILRHRSGSSACGSSVPSKGTREHRTPTPYSGGQSSAPMPSMPAAIRLIHPAPALAVVALSAALGAILATQAGVALGERWLL